MTDQTKEKFPKFSVHFLTLKNGYANLLYIVI